MTETITGLLKDSVKKFGEQPKLWINGRWWSFKELDDHSDGAGELLGFQAKPGDRVSAYLPNGFDYLTAYLGSLKRGLIFNPLNRLYGHAEVLQAIEDYDPATLLLDELAERDMKGLIFNPPGSLNVGVIPLPGKDAIFNPDPESTAFPPVDGETNAGIFSTSGTTGRAKGAMLTHGNFTSNIDSVTNAWRWTSEDRLVITLPLFHMHGLGVAFHGFLKTGCELIVLEKFDAETVLRELQDRKATMFFGVPTMYYRFLQVESPERFDLSNMRLFVSGSAPLPEEVFKEFKAKFGHEPLERYGMTETVMLMGNPYDGPRIPGSVGFPFEGVEARLVDPKTSEIAEKEGEVQVRGPNVFKGYYKNPEATEASFQDGWFRTGDLATRDSDGRYFLNGRISELILVGGYNVYPREVEEAIESHPSIDECAVKGIPDPDLGQKIGAWIVLKEGEDLPDLASWLEGRLGRFKIPHSFKFIQELPRNAMGKVTKKNLQ